MNDSAAPVLVGGVEVAPGEVALTLETEGGSAESAPDALPYGDYLVREVEAPEGYLGTDAEVPFSIAEDGEVVELTGERAVANQVRRGDLELVKVSDGDLSRMAGVPFRITSATTGESHVVVTDGNGYASTAASWVPHTASTNANDQAADGSWGPSYTALPSLAPLPELSTPVLPIHAQAVTMADEALPGAAPGTTPGGLPQTGDWSWALPAACVAGAVACFGGAIALGSRRRAGAGAVLPGPRHPRAHARGGKRWRP